MKKLAILFAMVVSATFAFAQGNSQTLHVAATKVTDGIGDTEILEIRVSGNNVSQLTGMGIEFDNNSRASILPMTKATTEGSTAPGNSGNNGTDVWLLNMDIDQFADPNGNISFTLTPPCCYIPQGGIVVRSKGR